MANLYWSGEKAPQKDVYAALMKELVECTDDAFEVKFGGHGAGAHLTVYVEADNEYRDPYPWNKKLPPKFMGWRVVIVFVPPTYIDIILRKKEEA